MPTKSAKMNQDGPTWAAKVNEVRNPVAWEGAPAGRFARVAAPVELEFEKKKKVWQDLLKKLQTI